VNPVRARGSVSDRLSAMIMTLLARVVGCFARTCDVACFFSRCTATGGGRSSQRRLREWV